MKSYMLEQLAAAGNDIEEYLDRFEGDEETCEMLTSMFTQDTQFTEYLESYEQKDYPECRKHIHNLKGTTANIGLTLLSRKAVDIMHAIDSGTFDTIPQLNEQFSELYYSTIKILTE